MHEWQHGLTFGIAMIITALVVSLGLTLTTISWQAGRQMQESIDTSSTSTNTVLARYDGKQYDSIAIQAVIKNALASGEVALKSDVTGGTQYIFYDLTSGIVASNMNNTRVVPGTATTVSLGGKTVPVGYEVLNSIFQKLNKESVTTYTCTYGYYNYSSGLSSANDDLSRPVLIIHK